MDRKAFLGLVPLAAASGLEASGSGRARAPGPDAKRFVGTYRLISSPGGGDQPVGRIHYDRFGRMQVMLHRRDRPLLPENPTAEDYRESIRGMQSYFGTYTVDEVANTVTHHIEGALSPNDVGKDRVRWYSFEGDRLYLYTSRDATTPLVWERLP